MKAAAMHGYTLEFRNNLDKQAVHDYKDNNLINACLLQFPYGRGEQKMMNHGTLKH